MWPGLGKADSSQGSVSARSSSRSAQSAADLNLSPIQSQSQFQSQFQSQSAVGREIAMNIEGTALGHDSIAGLLGNSRSGFEEPVDAQSTFEFSGSQKFQSSGPSSYLADNSNSSSLEPGFPRAQAAIRSTRNTAKPVVRTSLNSMLERVEQGGLQTAFTSAPRAAVDDAGSDLTQGGSNLLKPQDLLRLFKSNRTSGMNGINGSSISGSNNASSNQEHQQRIEVTGQVEALLQRAQDQAAQAESDAQRAFYGDNRQGAASSAQYHANDARAAADTAASITAYASGSSKSYAAQARASANSAQGAAERALANSQQ